MIPALVRYNPEKNPPGEEQNQAIRYLEFVVNERHNRNPAIHNYLLSLYAEVGDENALLQFLHDHLSDPCYDLKFALRLCHDKAFTTACVFVYEAMGLYGEAVDKALEEPNLPLAKSQANKPEEEDVRKKLWQRIARHVVDNATEAQDRKAYASSLVLLSVRFV